MYCFVLYKLLTLQYFKTLTDKNMNSLTETKNAILLEVYNGWKELDEAEGLNKESFEDWKEINAEQLEGFINEYLEQNPLIIGDNSIVYHRGFEKFLINSKDGLIHWGKADKFEHAIPFETLTRKMEDKPEVINGYYVYYNPVYNFYQISHPKKGVDLAQVKTLDAAIAYTIKD